MLIVLALAWAYVQYGSAPQAVWLLFGIKPVVVAVIVQALWKLLRTAVKGPLLAAVGLLVLGSYLGGLNAIALIFGSGLLVMAIKNGGHLRRGDKLSLLAFLPGVALPTAMAQFSLANLFLTCL
jgi:chromate transporter